MTPALPPSSSVTRFFGSSPFRYQPISDEPVNEILRNRSSRAMPSATFELTGSTWYMPFGRSVSAKNSARRSEPIGVALAGLTTIGAPTASDGATLCATRLSGKLNGVMPSTGPIGNRRSSPMPRAERRLGVQAHQLVVAVPDHLRRPAERRDRARRLDRGPLERLAALGRDQLRVLLDRLAQPPRDVIEGVGARAHRQLLRLLERRRRRRPTASSTSAAVGTPISATTLSSYGLLHLEGAFTGAPLPVHQVRTDRSSIRSPLLGDAGSGPVCGPPRGLLPLSRILSRGTPSRA